MSDYNPVKTFYRAAAATVIAAGLTVAPRLGLVDIVKDVNAQEAKVQTVAYQGSNLSGLGVPDYEKLPITGTIFVSKSDSIKGNETRIDRRSSKDKDLFVYSINVVDYAVAIDTNRDLKMEELFLALTGPGTYEKFDVNKGFTAPKWISK